MVEEVKINLIQLAKLIIFFANESSTNLYKTKLTKLLFYAQFLYYKIYNEKLLSQDFIKDYYGPVLEKLDEYLMFISDAGIIELCENKYGLIIAARFDLAEGAYSIRELEVLKKVNEKFKKYTAADISDYLHLEPLWSDTPLKGKFNIARAKELNEFEVMTNEFYELFV